MRFQQKIRVHMVLMGLVGALALANSARAQQEVDPDFFADAAGTPQLQQVAVVPAGQALQAAPAAEAAAPGELVAQEMEASGFTPLDENAAILLMFGAGAVVLLGIAEAIRGSRRRTFGERYASGLPSGATTN